MTPYNETKNLNKHMLFEYDFQPKFVVYNDADKEK